MIIPFNQPCVFGNETAQGSIITLNLKGMIANRKLAKSVTDMSFYKFRRHLRYIIIVELNMWIVLVNMVKLNLT